MQKTQNERLADSLDEQEIHESFRRDVRLNFNHDGTVGAYCVVCPRKKRDRRFPEVRAFWTSFKGARKAEAFAWWRAHRATDLHRWYGSHEPVEPTTADVIDALAHGRPAPRWIKPPFEFAESPRGKHWHDDAAA